MQDNPPEVEDIVRMRKEISEQVWDTERRTGGQMVILIEAEPAKQ